MIGFDEPPTEEMLRRRLTAYREAQARCMLRCYTEHVGTLAPDVDTQAAWIRSNDDKLPHDRRGKVVPTLTDFLVDVPTRETL